MHKNVKAAKYHFDLPSMFPVYWVWDSAQNGGCGRRHLLRRHDRQ